MMCGIDFKIRQMRPQDVAAVVSIHLRKFPGYFLSTMGEAFLCAYYESMLKQDGSINVVVEVDAEVVGFCVGGREASVSFRSLFRRYWRDLVPPLLKKFITSPTAAVSMMLRAQGLSVAVGHHGKLRICELSSIASDQSGGGAVLLDAFLKAASASYDAVHLSTRKHDNERVISFYTNNGFEITDEFRRAEHDMLELVRFRLKTGPI